MSMSLRATGPARTDLLRSSSTVSGLPTGAALAVSVSAGLAWVALATWAEAPFIAERRLERQRSEPRPMARTPGLRAGTTPIRLVTDGGGRIKVQPKFRHFKAWRRSELTAEGTKLFPFMRRLSNVYETRSSTSFRRTRHNHRRRDDVSPGESADERRSTWFLRGQGHCRDGFHLRPADRDELRRHVRVRCGSKLRPVQGTLQSDQ